MSSRLTQRVRRSTLVTLTGAALVALMSVTSAAAAPLVRSGDVRAASPVDVFTMDFPSDPGIQPHTQSIWASPDIKVCNTAVECPESQNPIVGQRNYIFINLRNPGPYGDGAMEQGEIHVYRSTPGGGTAWPGDWTEIGWTNVPVYAGVTTVVIPWDGVPGPGHFCLLTRWVSPNDPMTFEGPETSVNTRHNNNISWRNVDSVALAAGGAAQERPFTIGNPLGWANRNSLIFREVGAPLRTAGGRIVVDLGPTLFERWAQGGKAGKAVREVGRYQVEILDPAQARLDNLTLQGKEQLAFKLSFTATTPTKEKMGIQVAQFGPDGTGAQFTDRGGVQYDVTVSAPKG